MRHVRKIAVLSPDDASTVAYQMEEYFGLNMGNTFYTKHGYHAYPGSLPLVRLDIQGGEDVDGVIMGGELVELEAPEETPLPKRYSQRAIIRELGEGWEYVRAQLEEAKVLDIFFAAEYLQDDDEDFVPWLAKLTDEQKQILARCEIPY